MIDKPISAPEQAAPFWRDTLLLIVLGLLLIVPGLGIGDLPGLPVIDRDEARYAQASVQMMETGDYVDIRFQDRARHKKPAGAYWAQVLSVKAFSTSEARQIWAHRIPSALAGLLTILVLYWGCVSIVGRKIAFVSAIFLAISAGFIFEAHIAKTDALICLCACACLVGLLHLRHRATHRPNHAISFFDPAALSFWIGMGAAIMIKGPIVPILIGFCLLSVIIWDKLSPLVCNRSGSHWLRPLSNPLGILLCLMIVLPWSIAIWKETNGAFFTGAIGGDLLPKLKGGQESHGAPMGYYLVSTWFAFWPSSIVLAPALALGLKLSMPRQKNEAALDSETDTELNARIALERRHPIMRLLVCWILPFYILLELTPTKLPHYTLPLYPALAILCAYALYAIGREGNMHPRWWRYGSVIFIGFSLILLAALAGAHYYYSSFSIPSIIIFSAAALLSILVVFHAKAKSNPDARLKILVGLALLTNVYTYQFVMPSLQSMHIAARVQTALTTHHITPKDHRIVSLHYFEPSLIYHLGTHTEVGKAQERVEAYRPAMGDVLILDQERKTYEQYLKVISDKTNLTNYCLNPIDTIKGFNYAKGDPVNLSLLQIGHCD